MKVAVIMGSKSDLPVMQDAIDTLALFEIETHVDIDLHTELPIK